MPVLYQIFQYFQLAFYPYPVKGSGKGKNKGNALLSSVKGLQFPKGICIALNLAIRA